jgi:nucleoside diphosphate kinase
MKEAQRTAARSRDGIPEFLSDLSEKRILYANDVYFKESFEDLSRVMPGDVDAFCRTHTLMMLKPDAAVTRQVTRALRWVTQNGFIAVGAVRVSMCRHAIRALWQYGLNAASRDRRDAADLYVTAGDCLLVLLACPDATEPATTMLSRIKGPANPGGCHPGQLRHEIGSFNYQLNLVHTADEPADLIRELGVLCDQQMRVRLYEQALAGDDRGAEAADLATQLEDAVGAEDLDLGQTILALTSAADSAPSSVAPHRRSALVSLLDEVRAGRSKDWRRVLALADEIGLPIGPWQRIVLATYLLEPYEPGAVSMLPDASTVLAGRSPMPLLDEIGKHQR